MPSSQRSEEARGPTHSRSTSKVSTLLHELSDFFFFFFLQRPSFSICTSCESSVVGQEKGHRLHSEILEFRSGLYRLEQVTFPLWGLGHSPVKRDSDAQSQSNWKPWGETIGMHCRGGLVHSDVL